eukprot:9222-Eustigmatos_ZCMA.PRE.1
MSRCASRTWYRGSRVSRRCIYGSLLARRLRPLCCHLNETGSRHTEQLLFTACPPDLPWAENRCHSTTSATVCAQSALIPSSTRQLAR